LGILIFTEAQLIETGHVQTIQTCL